MPPLLAAITEISNAVGTPFDLTGVEELRVVNGLTIVRVEGDGPPRLEIGYGSPVASVTGTLPIVVGGTSAIPLVSINAATDSLRGSMSAADKTKLDAMGDGATVVSITGSPPVNITGTDANPNIDVDLATGASSGLMSAAHYALVNGATAAATALTLFKRDASGGGNLDDLTAESITVGKLGTGAASFACPISMVAKVDTYAATVTLRGIDGGHHEVTLTGNVTFAAPTNFADDPTIEVFVIQGAGGSHTATWAAAGSSGFAFGTGFSGTLIATAAGDADYFSFKHRTLPASHWVCTNHFKYSPP